MCECGKKVVNFVVAATNHILNGGPTTSDEAAYRMEICQNCEKFNQNMCDECGCYLPIKTSWKEQECPLGKWPQIT